MTDSQNTNGEQPAEGQTAGAASNDAPQYGQYQQPEYGAMASQYPAGYNPYVYGAPDPTPATLAAPAANAQPNAGAAGQANAGYGQPPYAPQSQPQQPANGAWGQPNPYVASGQQPAGGNAGYGQPPYMQQSQQTADGHTPRYFHGIDVNDPRQNPLYGHWDAYAIIALVCALFFPVPVLPAVMGAISMWRTRMLNMKGFWLAFAAVFINVFFTIMSVWLMLNGMSVLDYYQQMLTMLEGGSAGSGGTDGPISA
ncbi:hypothetical protein KIH79_01700 [Bifidobacterium sp. 82T10]|uniref:DUF4190 domain-containing protein n=1 Tax=Bifidobacterium miconis TaxID=2834435 RepID=A0ABS6WEL3_9BIFI|nr:hypothetical protein [Bifidobacterium miconis]MBW3091686.1 hypothetical protein [Bifidobacterium miconis]